jgi:uncharacterized membrane protein YgaE (UPF0421/DUF939 family)
MDGVVIVGLLIAGVINFVMFFKIWSMTNDVKGIHKLIFAKEALLRKGSNDLENTVNQTIIKELSRHT